MQFCDSQFWYIYDESSFTRPSIHDAGHRSIDDDDTVAKGGRGKSNAIIEVILISCIFNCVLSINEILIATEMDRLKPL